MLPSNIEDKLTKFLEKQGGWARVEECAKDYAKDPITGEINASRRTKLYKWKKKVEKGKIATFQIVRLPANIVYLGLKSADPNKVLQDVVSNKEITRQMRGFFDRFKRKKKTEALFDNAEAMAIAHFYQHDTRYMRNFSKLYVWIKRGARPEEMPELEK